MHSLAHIELAPLSESEILRRARARRDRRRAGTTSGAPVVSRVARYAILLSALVVAVVLANAAAAHASQFANWAQAPGAVAVAGDFNGDGRGDVALVGPGGWSTVPVAFFKRHRHAEIRQA